MPQAFRCEEFVPAAGPVPCGGDLPNERASCTMKVSKVEKRWSVEHVRDCRSGEPGWKV